MNRGRLSDPLNPREAELSLISALMTTAENRTAASATLAVTDSSYR
jgi:hypothetical protein